MKKVLIIRLSGLGDVAMILPVVYSAARQNTGVQFDVLTRPFFAELFINCPPNVSVITTDYEGEHAGLKGTFRLIKQLKKNHYDGVADLHNVSRSWLINMVLWLCGAKVVMLDKKRMERGKAVNRHKTQPLYTDRYAEVLRRMGLKCDLTFKTLFDTPPTLPMEIKNGAIGIAPFAKYINKTYPMDLMRAVVERLTAAGHYVYLFGGRGKEADILATWQKEIDGCESLAGRFPITDELAVMSQLRLMLCMDSANQHLASLVGTRVITIWGGTTPICGFAPYGQDSSDSVVKGLHCQPCTARGSDLCTKGAMPCLRQLSPDMVVSRMGLTLM